MARAKLTYRNLEPFGFRGYRVGSDGSVWSRRMPGYGTRLYPQWHRLAPKPAHAGRLRVHLGARFVQVHRLVLLAFVGPCPRGKEGCHGDGRHTNNRLGNLRWGTKKANERDKQRHGTTARGERHGMAKLTAVKVQAMRADCTGGLPIRQAARKYGVSQRLVQKIVRREVWAHV